MMWRPLWINWLVLFMRLRPLTPWMKLSGTPWFSGLSSLLNWFGNVPRSTSMSKTASTPHRRKSDPCLPGNGPFERRRSETGLKNGRWSEFDDLYLRWGFRRKFDGPLSWIRRGHAFMAGEIEVTWWPCWTLSWNLTGKKRRLFCAAASFLYFTGRMW